MNNVCLERFLEAQEHMYSTALQEIKNGEKESHWMWYIFPQLRGLGSSKMSYLYGIDGLCDLERYYKIYFTYILVRDSMRNL